MSNWSLDLRGGVAVLTFTRPPRNYFDFASSVELGDHLEALSARADEAKAVILTGGVDG